MSDNDENGPSRTTAVEEIRAKAAHLLSRADDYRRESAQLTALANQLEAIQAFSASRVPNGTGGESDAPYIGVGSDAEHALWRLVLRDSGG